MKTRLRTLTYTLGTCLAWSENWPELRESVESYPRALKVYPELTPTC